MTSITLIFFVFSACFLGTLFLSSGGIRHPIIKEEFLKILPKNPENIRLAHIYTAAKVKENTDYVEEARKVFKELCLQVTEYDLSGKSEEDLRGDLSGMDVLYVQGGNGFYLLSEVYKSGFDKVVEELLDKGVIYVGISAGTYIACPTIEMHEWKRIQDNHYGLTDFKALNLVPFLITVHYNREKYRENVLEGITKTSYPVKILTDDQALLVVDGKVTLVGVGEEINLNQDFNQFQYQNNFQIYVEHNKDFEVGGGSPEARVRLLLNYLPESKTVFDIGSGVGADAIALKSAGYEVIASDFVHKFIDELKNKGLNAIFFDAKRDEIPDGIDCIYANAVFVHLSPEDVSNFLVRAKRKLNDEKLVFISVIKGDGYERSARAKGFERDFYYYQLDSMTELLDKSGYKVLFSNDHDPKWLQIIARAI